MTTYCGTGLRRALGVATAVAALLAVPSLASAQADETFSLAGVARVPGNPIVSFDISWIDTTINEYFLADRSNKSVDVIPIENQPPVFQIVSPTAPFAGAPGIHNCKPAAGANDCVGPNGVLTFNNPNGDGLEVWVGDGPTTPAAGNTSCVAGQPWCSTVKVYAGLDAHLKAIINTFGAARADELCVDPVHHVVLVANDAESPWPFVTFINTDNYTLAAHLIFDGTSTNGGAIAAPKATNGIEQCQFRPKDGNFYINIPENGTAPGTPGDDSVGGVVVVLSPTLHTVLRIIPVDVTQCAGPQGMAVGPDPQILLGCFAPTSVNGGTLNGPQNVAIMNADTGNLQVVGDQGGTDQVWFEPGSKHYFLAAGGHLPSEQIGVIDALTGTPDLQSLNFEQCVQFGCPPTGTSTGNPINQQAIFVGFAGSTTRRTHSVAAWSGTVSPGPGAITLAMVPVPPVGGTPAAFSSILCDPIETQGCVAFFRSNGIGDEP